MNEKFEKLEDLMITEFNKAELAINEDRTIYAFKCLCKSYKIALKLKNGIYMDKCASNLVNVCSNVAKFYMKLASNRLSWKEHHACSNLLRKAKKVAKIGMYFEQHYHKTENEEIFNKIEELIDKNKEALSELRRERFDNLIEGCSSFFESIGDFISDVFSSDYSYSYDDESIEDTKNENDSNPEYQAAVKDYNAGINVLNKTLTINRSTDLSYAIDYFEDCYRASKDKFPDLKHDALEMIAKCYFELGEISENEGERCMTYRSYNTARDYYSDAERYYLKGQENLPSDCRDYFSDAISRVRSSYINADYQYRYDD